LNDDVDRCGGLFLNAFAQREGCLGKIGSVMKKKSSQSVQKKAEKRTADRVRSVSKDGKSVKKEVEKVSKKAVSKKPQAAAKRPKAESADRSSSRKSSRKSAESVSTAVVAVIDVGFGNQLFIRGEGPGLSWDRGVEMKCIAADRWHWSADNVEVPFPFKVLVNDRHWAVGENQWAKAGETTMVSPDFWAPRL